MPVVSFDDFNIDIIAEHAGGDIEQFKAKVDTGAEISRHANGGGFGQSIDR